MSSFSSLDVADDRPARPTTLSAFDHRRRQHRTGPGDAIGVEIAKLVALATSA